jgi:regulatory protein
MLKRKLIQADYGEAAVEAALDRAAGQRYLDDQAFARSLVRRRSAGRGRALIARELHARGIDSAEAGEALDQIDPMGELERARTLARSILRGKPQQPQQPLGREQLRATVGGRLGRRGFSTATITRVLRELAAEGVGVSFGERRRFDTPSEPD